ncbi:MAG: NADH dehydrogenase I subunit [Planctomycetota bacterium]|nr:MAG: NADH dehydrogenase I subunit [Planctomycetota bacterium]
MPINFTIDGKQVQGEKGETVLPVALRNNIDVPYFCYHPGLSLSGNCRMCLVRVTPAAPPPPKPGPDGKLPPAPPPPRSMLAISCMTQIADGMTVDTKTPDVLRAREGVMEFELINHPLDCPTCDQAGECFLQDHSYQHGRSHGRFYEERQMKHTKSLGPTISIWGSRCIVCSRCVRFTDEITGTGELCIVNRSDHSVVDVFPGKPLDNALSMCAEDVCPVGALISEDFKFKARVWFMKEQKTLCAGCSVGCNVVAEQVNEEIARLKPRENLAVNDWWMCDAGRLSYKQHALPGRLVEARVDGKAVTRAEAVLAAWQRLSAAGGAVAGLVSLWNTNEEMFLFRRLMKLLSAVAPMGTLEKSHGERKQFKGGFVIEGDRNPNRAGARAILGDVALEVGATAVRKAFEAGTVNALLVVSGAPELAISPEIEAMLARVKTLVVLDVLESSSAAKYAKVRLPATMHWEQDGTFVNVDGRVQRVRPVIQPPGDAAPALELLQEIVNRHPPGGSGVLSGDGVFRQLGAEIEAFRELTYREVGDLGVPARTAAQAVKA